MHQSNQSSARCVLVEGKCPGCWLVFSYRRSDTLRRNRPVLMEYRSLSTALENDLLFLLIEDIHFWMTGRETEKKKERKNKKKKEKRKASIEWFSSRRRRKNESNILIFINRMSLIDFLPDNNQSENTASMRDWNVHADDTHTPPTLTHSPRQL